MQSENQSYEAERRLRDALKQAVEKETAPPELLEGIRAALHHRRDRTLSGRWALVALGLLAVFIGGMGIWFMRPPGVLLSPEAQHILSMGAAAYQRCPTNAGLDSLGSEYNG